MSAIDYIICECTPCRECDGQGEHFFRNLTGYTQSGLPIDKEYSVVCEECKGSGKDNEDCAVHGRQEPRIYARELQAFDPKFGITAAQLGIAEEVCPACSAGDHEMPGQPKCPCACHGRKPETVPALHGFGVPAKSPGIATIGNGLFVRTRRSA